ncbi:MAG: DUF1963 domain-containing protein [Planctomycetes bacterium]|nr:DUF1963 domain-containing protein [Planctomycetota bacterium]
MDRIELEATLRADCPTIAESIIARLRRCKSLRAVRTDESVIPVGASKFGGAADLPAGVKWPCWSAERGGGPLQLVSQINLAELDAHLINPALPKAGLLSFFYDTDEMPSGFAAGDETGSKVIFTSDTSNLVRVEPPVMAQHPVRTCRVVASTEWSMPSIWSAVPADVELSDDESDAYFDLRTDLALGTAQLLGFAEEIQHPIEEEAVQFKYGCYQKGKFDAELWEQVKHHVEEWTLLLQVGSDEELNVMWGDVGSIYYAIQTHDLEALNFDDTMLIFQCS